MKNNVKSIWKIAMSTFAILIILTLLSSGATARLNVRQTPDGAGTPPATHNYDCDHSSIDYTVVPASDDPRIVRFKDRSGGDASHIRWDFGDGDSATGISNPGHKFDTPGYYISEMTVECEECGDLLWLHKTLVIDD